MHDQEQRPDHVGKPGRTAWRTAPESASADVPLAGLGEGPGPVPRSVLALQRAAGNAAVARMLEQQRHSHSALCGHQAPDGGAATAPPQVQRSSVHDVLRSSGRPLDTPLRAEMEARLGADFSTVRVHDDVTAQRSSAEVGARAYTSGDHVVIGEGGADKHTLAHELTHVIQQRQGSVAGTDSGDGLRVSDPSDRFERAAEANAERVMRRPLDLQRATADGPGLGAATAAGGTVQRALGEYARLSLGLLRLTSGVPDLTEEERSILQAGSQTFNTPEEIQAEVARMRQAAPSETSQAPADQGQQTRPTAPPRVPPKPSELAAPRRGVPTASTSASTPVPAPAPRPSRAAVRPAPSQVTAASGSESSAPQNTPAHGGYTYAGTRQITCYRADGRPPEAIRAAGGMRAKEHRTVTAIMQEFLADPRGFAQAHVSSNKSYLVSAAFDEECGGYANNRHVYRIDAGTWHEFAPPPARSAIMRAPNVYANSSSLEEATHILIGPLRGTGEIDFFGGVDLSWISGYQAPSGGGFGPFNGTGTS